MTLPSVFVLGDSISIEYGPHLERALRGAFTYDRKAGIDEALSNLDIAQGANGGDSSMCLNYLIEHEQRGLPSADVLLLNCGLHDIKHTPKTGEKQIPLKDYPANLEALLTQADKLFKHTVWVRTTPVNETQHNRSPEDAFHRFNADVDAYNTAADIVMSKHNIPVIDLHRFCLTFGATNEILRDGRHYHESISQQQGAHIAGWLIGWWSGAKATTSTKG